jgi:hypothetical protein
MKKIGLVTLLVVLSQAAFCWGFFGHRLINYYAVFLLPPEMMVLYKPNIEYLKEHAVDPDKRRYLIPQEGPRHYLDIDHYGMYPYPALPRTWKEAVAAYSADTLAAHGIAPWWLQIMLSRLTKAFKEKNKSAILKLSAEIGHYIGDIHVPLHASGNHNGQLTGQQGIHGFWESRIPELFAEKEWDFYVGKANYIDHPLSFTWKRMLESAAAADSVLKIEKQLSLTYPSGKYAFEQRNGILVRQYSFDYTRAYYQRLNNMVERRMREAIEAVADFWYTAWVNAGQPDLTNLSDRPFTEEEYKELDDLNIKWKTIKVPPRSCEEPVDSL